jgi:hypothetical protein
MTRYNAGNATKQACILALAKTVSRQYLFLALQVICNRHPREAAAWITHLVSSRSWGDGQVQG